MLSPVARGCSGATLARMSRPPAPHRPPDRPWRVIWWGVWSGLVFGVAWAVVDFFVSIGAQTEGSVLAGWILLGVMCAAVPWTQARGAGLLRRKRGWLPPLIASLVALAVFVIVALVGLGTLVAMAVTGGGP